jgi:outer membrane protein assembly factor BamB
MKFHFAALVVVILFVIPLRAQDRPRTYLTTSNVGLSALSTDSLFTKTVHLPYPLWQAVADTAYEQVLFSTRQKGENNEEVYLNKGGFGSLNTRGDTVRWMNETALYDIQLPGANLVVSNDARSIKFNRRLGYDEQRFPSRLIYVNAQMNAALYYEKESDSLRCADLQTGDKKWCALIPRAGNWSDHVLLNDSVLIIAASGLHAVDLKRGLLWTIQARTSVVNDGALVYSRARNTTIKGIGNPVLTAVNDTLVNQLSSNILIQNNRIYFASKDDLMCIDANGKVIWKNNLSDYDLAKTRLSPLDTGFLLVNFGLAVHSGNLVIWGTPFLLMADPVSGLLTDQYDLSEIDNLSDFMIGKRGLSFGGKTLITEVKPSSGQVKNRIPLGVFKYGEFVEFINGDDYYVMKEGFYVPLNFIDDNLVYFLADNNKIYGLDGASLIYEYHFTELFKFAGRMGDRNLLQGLDQTIITSRSFEPLATLNLSEKFVVCGKKIYFLQNEKIHIFNMEELR